jgi:hypothetical protein
MYTSNDNYETEQNQKECDNHWPDRKEDIRPEDLPFYYDSIGIRETFGKGINDGRIKEW